MAERMGFQGKLREVLSFAREREELTSAAVYPQVLGEIYCDRKPWEG